MVMQKHWYLGFFGIVGIWMCPEIWAAPTADGAWLDLTYLFWFLWFLYLVPETKDQKADRDSTRSHPERRTPHDH